MLLIIDRDNININLFYNQKAKEKYSYYNY